MAWAQHYTQYFNLFTAIAVLLLSCASVLLVRNLVKLARTALWKRRSDVAKARIGRGQEDAWPDGLVVYRQGAMIAPARRILLSLVLVVCSLPFLYAGWVLAQYVSLEFTTEIVTVTVQPSSPGSVSLAVVGQSDAQPVQVDLPGRYWFVEGDFLRFPGWARYIGLRSCARITRVLALDQRKDMMTPGAWRSRTLSARDYLFPVLRRVGRVLGGLEGLTQYSSVQSSNPAIVSILATRSGFAVLARPAGAQR